MYRIPILIVFIGLTACAAGPPDSATLAAAVTTCKEPRPQLCTLDYRPVCGSLNDGGVKTYANGCGACADASIVSWVEGACSE